MNRYKMTYRELVELSVADNSVLDDLYVKTHKGEFSKVNAVVEKESEMKFISFSNGVTLEASTGHAFMSTSGESIFVDQLKHNMKVMTTGGPVSVTSIKNSKNTKCYDINIEAPHWYVNDESGFIHHNTILGLFCIKAYLDKHKDAVCLYYDSEFGSPPAYLAQFGIDLNRVLHTPVIHVEQLKFDIVAQLENIDRGDKVIIFLDSIGNLASKKETDDAIDQKSVGDMSRAKAIKSLFRIVTPQLTVKDIPCIVINHTIQSIGLFSSTVVTGGCLVPGTKIQLANNTLKNIEDINTGDLVKTLLGPREVTNVWNPNTLEDGTPQTYRITFEDGYTVECSAEHKFAVHQGADVNWVTAKDLVEGLDCAIAV